MVATVATTLGAATPRDRSIPEAVIAHLRSEQCLLVLDNCEHVLPGTAELVAMLLDACPALQVLATSRAPLRVRGRTGVAGAGAGSSATRRYAPGCCRRGASRRALCHDCSGSDAEVCVDRVERRYHCGDLPALRWAAAGDRAGRGAFGHAVACGDAVATGPAIAGRRHGTTGCPDRHRTVSDAIAWSYRLISASEQAVFRSLSVFSGGWTLDAAATVSGLSVAEAVDRLDALVDQSLVVCRADVDASQPRFALLETIREFALEQLERHPEEAATVRRAHAGFFADMALAARSGLRSGDSDAVRCVRAEQDNLRAMLNQLLDAGDAETALRVAGGSLSEYWLVAGGQIGEGRAWLERTLRLAENVSPAARVWGLYGRHNSRRAPVRPHRGEKDRHGGPDPSASRCRPDAGSTELLRALPRRGSRRAIRGSNAARREGCRCRPLCRRSRRAGLVAHSARQCVLASG